MKRDYLSEAATATIALPKLPSDQVTKAKSEIAVLRAEQQRRNTIGENLFPIEKSDKVFAEIDAKSGKNRKRIRDLRRQVFVSESPYPCLDLSPLRWRDEKGNPRLAVFNLDDWGNRRFAISGDGQIWPDSLPEEIKGLYRDVADRLRVVSKPRNYLPALVIQGSGLLLIGFALLSSNASSWLLWLLGGSFTAFGTFAHYDRPKRVQNKSIWVNWSGLIPYPIRQKIKAVRSQFERIFLIAEVEDWQKGTLPVDPLVCGWRAGQLWLIGRFDLTDVEHLIASENALVPDPELDSIPIELPR